MHFLVLLSNQMRSFELNVTEKFVTELSIYVHVNKVRDEWGKVNATKYMEYLGTVYSPEYNLFILEL
jgi:hypothetical protein